VNDTKRCRPFLNSVSRVFRHDQFVDVRVCRPGSAPLSWLRERCALPGGDIRSGTASDEAADRGTAIRRATGERNHRSLPNLVGIDIRLKRFQSDADYFRTSFSAARFIAGVKMRYFVLVNPEWRSRGAPVEGVQAILAHELAHVDDLTRGKRIRLFGLMGLVSKTRTARFERRADLIAVARDYGSGLKAYRAWLFNHVPPEKLAEKQRDYFSPEEIDAILAGTAEHPELFDYWLRHVPMSLTDIQSVR
jgi:hypothetical protein